MDFSQRTDRSGYIYVFVVGEGVVREVPYMAQEVSSLDMKTRPFYNMEIYIIFLFLVYNHLLI